MDKRKWGMVDGWKENGGLLNAALLAGLLLQPLCPFT